MGIWSKVVHTYVPHRRSGGGTSTMEPRQKTDEGWVSGRGRDSVGDLSCVVRLEGGLLPGISDC